MPEPTIICIGDEATAATPLRPGGAVIVNGERHSARSRGFLIDKDAKLVVIGGDNHGLLVDRIESIGDRKSLPNFGAAVYSNFGDAAAAKAEEADRQAQEWLRERKRWIARNGPTVGGALTVIGALLGWSRLVEHFGASAAGWFAVLLIPGGMALGYVLLLYIDRSLREFDFELHRFSLASVGMIFVGIVLGGIWAIPRYGLFTGSLRAAAGGLLFGVPLPVTLAVLAGGGEGEESIG